MGLVPLFERKLRSGFSETAFDFVVSQILPRVGPVLVAIAGTVRHSTVLLYIALFGTARASSC